MQCFVRTCKAIFGHWSCHAKNRLGSKPTKMKTCMYTVGAKKNVVSATVGPVTDTYFELEMLCLFYFVLKSENTGIILRLQWYMRNNSISFFFIPISDVN